MLRRTNNAPSANGSIRSVLANDIYFLLLCLLRTNNPDNRSARVRSIGFDHHGTFFVTADFQTWPPKTPYAEPAHSREPGHAIVDSTMTVVGNLGGS